MKPSTYADPIAITKSLNEALSYAVPSTMKDAFILFGEDSRECARNPIIFGKICRDASSRVVFADYFTGIGILTDDLKQAMQLFGFKGTWCVARLRSTFGDEAEEAAKALANYMEDYLAMQGALLSH